MTDKPDVAALLIQICSVRSGTVKAELAKRIAAELTRLVAERDGKAMLLDEARDALNELRPRFHDANAEIARLTDLAQQRKWQLEECESDLAKAEAEIYERDVWKSKAEYYGRSKERVALTAEIARLREWKTAAENLIAAIRLDSGIAYPWPALDLAEAALNPDTGETP